MKVLLLGDASNCHRALATGLQRLGHTAVVASDGTKWMNTDRNIDLRRRWSNPLGGLDLWLRANRMLPQLSGFDVVEISSPIFVELRPQRCLALFNRIRNANRSVFLTALGTDSPYVEECTDPHSALRYSEFRHFGKIAPHAANHPEIEQAWLTDPLWSHCNEIYRNVNGVIAILYEYYLSAKRWLPPHKLAYGGIPIDTDSLTPVFLPENPSPIRFFLGRHADRMDIKGTDRMESALRNVMARHPGKIELIIVENKPYAEYLRLLKSAHVVLDQAYSYTPATNALLAMAYGKCVVSGAEPEYYDFIGEPSNFPIINCPIDTNAMERMFEQIIANPHQLRPRGLASREFVVKHNDCVTVARRFVDCWTSHLNNPTP